MNSTSPVTTLLPLRSAGRQEDIYQALREAIVNGVFAPGERLPERELAKQFVTSQTPVREALRRLGQEGLVVTHAYRGTYVRQLSAGEVEEVFSLRAELEAWAVRRFIPLATEADVQELRGYVEAMREAMTSDNRVALADADMKFHYKICEGSNSTMLLGLWGSLDGQIRSTITLLKRASHKVLRDHVATHKPILDAIAARDVAAAETLVRHHPIVAPDEIKLQLDSIPGAVAPNER
jgi:DNA-binding GntR family transcriptional regulator